MKRMRRIKLLGKIAISGISTPSLAGLTYVFLRTPWSAVAYVYLSLWACASALFTCMCLDDGWFDSDSTYRELYNRCEDLELRAMKAETLAARLQDGLLEEGGISDERVR